MIEYCEYGHTTAIFKRRGMVMRKARAIYAPHPWMPAAFRGNTGKLSVRLLFRIAADGSFTSDLLGSSGYSAVDAAVLDSIVRWRFEPAAIGSRRVASYRQIRISLPLERF